MRGTWMLVVVAVLLVFGCVLVARGAETREVKVEKTDALALQELGRRGGELGVREREIKAAREALEADTAEVMSAFAVRYKIAPHERVVAFDPSRGVIVIANEAKAAPPVGAK